MNSKSNTSEFDDYDSDAGVDSKHDESAQHVARLAIKETRNVRMWRRNVFVMLFVTASLVTILIFLLLRDEDQEDFHTAFQQFTSTISDSTKYNLLGVLEATDGLSDVLTSDAEKSNLEWPFVTMSAFEVFVRHTRAQASSEFIVVAPIVTPEQMVQWGNYSTKNQGWIYDSLKVSDAENITNLDSIPESIHRLENHEGLVTIDPEDGYEESPMAPFWLMSPPPVDTSIVNFNAFALESYQEMYDNVVKNRHWTLGMANPNAFIDYAYSEEHDSSHTQFPHTTLMYPVYRTLDEPDSDVVALVINILPWDNYLSGALPEGVNGVYCVLHNSWNQVFTYMIRGNDALFIGEGDMHDKKYDNMERIIEFSEFFQGNEDLSASLESAGGEFQYWLAVYPSEELESAYKTKNPMIFALISLSAFAMMTLTFILYDRFVIRKNNKILDAAAHSDAILSSLFPKEVKDRLLQEKRQRDSGEKSVHNLKQFLNGDDSGGANDDVYQSKPIADLFPETTVFFADLVGFTAWSSTRDPSSVFVLLETLFRAFDKIARRTSVYKVETIGDCYVAIAGLPEPRQDHAVIMVRFAVKCMEKMQQLTRKLDETLGPETSDLSMRIGLHSGPVTAGVLRGERSRFQLFGDTVNTAARMESNGQPGRIHMSQDTANLLEDAGKGHWIEKRTDIVRAKGKGEMQTYWLIKSQGCDETGDTADESASSFGTDNPFPRVAINDEMHRLIQWNFQRFSVMLKEIAESRQGKLEMNKTSIAESHSKEGIRLPRRPSRGCIDVDSTKLNPAVFTQLDEYISLVASRHATHAFHNFQHATHAIMSILKLLSQFQKQSKGGSKCSTEEVHRILADPFTQFACAFTALIHDINHPGVPNARLIEEDPEVATYYKGRSVAEQRSFDIAWNLLQEDRFKLLRSAIYSNSVEENKFRQLISKNVMSTDIFDHQQTELRNARWKKVVVEATGSGTKCDMDETASVIIEHLIQASDIAHTIQHWSVYCKWNERLFTEAYQAFLDGRRDRDPTETWYDTELAFFDNYVIPLAKRLKECATYLGVSGDEYLVFAMNNRTEWVAKGQEIVQQMRRNQSSLRP